MSFYTEDQRGSVSNRQDIKGLQVNKTKQKQPSQNHESFKGFLVLNFLLFQNWKRCPEPSFWCLDLNTSKNPIPWHFQVLLLLYINTQNYKHILHLCQLLDIIFTSRNQPWNVMSVKVKPLVHLMSWTLCWKYW